MRIGRLATSGGPCCATWTDDSWTLIEDWAAAPNTAVRVKPTDIVEITIDRIRSLTSEVVDVDAISAVQADIVIESSGNHRGLASAIRGAARGGRVVVVGLLPTGEQPVLVSLAITRELELVGSFRFNDEIEAVIEALADRGLYVDPVITHEFPATRALEALAVAGDASRSSKVLVTF
jgi:L-idonate 5-dehydrogenase